MSAGRPTFRQIPAPLDVDDKALDRLNDKLDVPTLVRPTPPPPAPAMPSTAQGKPQDSPNDESRPTPSRNTKNSRAVEKSTPASRDRSEKLSIELPRYLARAMRMQAVEKDTTVRYIVMEALAASGFAIEPADLVVHGRRRPSPQRKR
jgi:hypothetical protein